MQRQSWSSKVYSGSANPVQFVMIIFRSDLLIQAGKAVEFGGRDFAERMIPYGGHSLLGRAIKEGRE